MAGLLGIFRPLGLTQDDRAAVKSAAQSLDYSGSSTADRWSDAYLCVARVRHAFERSRPLATEGPDGIITVIHGRIYDAASPDGAEDGEAARCRAVYDRAGVAGCAQLNGQFNLVVYDPKARSLVLVNDRLASQPLFYRPGRERLAFASQARTVAELMGEPIRLDLASLRQFLVFQTILSEDTLVEGVGTLPPAGALRYAEGSSSVSRYWTLQYHEDGGRSEQDHAESLADVLRRAIRRGMVSADGAALLLSGGLDSRALVAVAPPMPAVTLGDWENDELRVARAIAGRRDLPLTFVRRPPDFYPDLVDLGTALGDGAYRFDNAHFARLREALPSTITALLSGYGFDLLVKGDTVPRRRLRFRGTPLNRHALLEIPERIGRDGLVDIVLNTMGGCQWKHPATRRLFAASTWPAVEAGIRNVVGGLLDRARDLAPSPQQRCEYVRMSMLATRFPAYLNVLGIRHYFRDLTISLDNEVLDQHLTIPPRLRMDGRVYRRALALLAPDIYRIPDANTGFAPGTHYLVEHALGGARRLAGRLGVGTRTAPPDPTFTHGSWPNMGELIRRRPVLVNRIADTIGDDNAIPGDVFDVPFLKKLLGDHVERRVDATWPLLLVLTAGTWHRAYVAGVGTRS
jgi:asparagine synthase (glutamine-hydrolysing)